MCRYSFGTAVQVLPIPELMPFRLTRQMTGALQPHDALALLQAPCTLAMTALRAGKDILEVCNPISLPVPTVSFFFPCFRHSFSSAKSSAPTQVVCMFACVRVLNVDIHAGKWPLASEPCKRSVMAVQHYFPFQMQWLVYADC